MNRHSFRIVFNAARDQLVAVAEYATSQSKGCGESTARPHAGNKAHTRCDHPENAASALALAALLLAQSTASAQVIADLTAPANQRPTVLTNPMGGPLVNIQTPSAAGVSRNTYSRFDVGNSQVVILNNNRSSNPWLAKGSARVILNEINSSNPSHLSGIILVDGQAPGNTRADVVFANPSGINVNGVNFAGIGRVTLTTGTPVMNSGELNGFNVTKGVIDVASLGMGVDGAGFADIISRSAIISGIVRAGQTINVVTGTQNVNYATGATTPLAGVGTKPVIAIDTRALGGMYAQSIILLSTEAGVGVRNQGTLQANTGSGQLIVTADGRLENTGRMDAAYTSVATVEGNIDNSGNLLGRQLLLASAGGDFNHVGTGLVQNAPPSPRPAPITVVGNTRNGVDQDAGSASQVFINAKRDVNLASDSRVASGANFTAANGDLKKGQVSIGAGRNVNLSAGSQVTASGDVQISSDGRVASASATLSSASSDVTVLAKQGINLNDSTATGHKVHLETGAVFQETTADISITGGRVNGVQQTAIISTGNLSVGTAGAAGVGSSAGHVYLQAGTNLTLSAGTTASAAGHFTAKAGRGVALHGIAGSTATNGQTVGVTAGRDVALAGGSVTLTGSRINATSGSVGIEASTGDITLNALVNAGGAAVDKVTLAAAGDLNVSAYGGSIKAQGLTGTGTDIHVASNGATRLEHIDTSNGPAISTLNARRDLAVASIHQSGAVDIIAADLHAVGTAQISTPGTLAFSSVAAGSSQLLPSIRGANIRVQGGSVTAPAVTIAATAGHASIVATSGALSLGSQQSTQPPSISATGNVALHAERNAVLQAIHAKAGSNLAVSSATGSITSTGGTLTADDMLSISSRGGQTHTAGRYTGGAMSVYNQTETQTLNGTILRSTGTNAAGLSGVSGQLSVESGGSVAADNATRLDAATDLSIITGTGGITIAPDRTASAPAGNLLLTTDQLRAGMDITVAARNGVLTLAGKSGSNGNPTAQAIALNAQRDLTLAGSAVEIQASRLGAGRDVKITSHSGAVLIDGIKSNFSAYIPQGRIDPLVVERAHYENLITQEQASLNSNQAYASLKRELTQLKTDIDHLLNTGYWPDFMLAVNRLIPLHKSKSDQVVSLEQNLTSLQAERDALTPVISTLSAPAKGGEHLGAIITGRNVNITSAAGMAIYGAEITGSGTVYLSTSGVLPIDTTTSAKLQTPTGTLIAGLSDFYEYGAADTNQHKFVLMSRPTVISGQAGVSIKAVGNDANARLVLNDSAVRSADGTVALQSLGDMRLEAGQEEFYSRTINTYTRKSWGGLKKKTTTETTTNQSVAASPVVLAGRSIVLKSGGSIDAEATEFQSPQGNIQITAANALNLRAVDEVSINNFNATTRSSFLGMTYSKATTADSRTVSEQLPSRLVASSASTASGWNTLLQGTIFQTSLSGAHIQAGVGPNARADAQIILEGIKKTVTESKTKESNYVVWQRQLGSGSTVETMTLPSFTGPQRPVFNAPGGLVVQVPDGELRTQIQTLSQQPGMAYLSDLSQRNDVDWQPVKLAFDQWSYKQEGLTPAGAALLSVAVAWATGGMGAGMLGTTGATSSAMANAAFMSLSSQAAITLVNNKGNIGKTLSDLARSDTVKATVAAALTAGVLDKVGALEGMKSLKDSSAFTDKLTHNLVNAGGRALTNTAINGGNLEEALKQALVGGLVDTAHGEVASQIKVLEGDYLAHKLAHALVGCVAGEAAGGACRDGAIGAAVGEVVVQMMPPADRNLGYTEAERTKALNYSKLVAGAVAAYAGGNAQTAITTAETAVKNNGLLELVKPRPVQNRVFTVVSNDRVVERNAAIDTERQRITLIQPAESMLYAAGTGGAQVEGYTVIFAHGSDGSIQGVKPSDTKEWNAFVEMIKTSGAWKPGQPILLEACNTGKIDTGVASALAKSLGTYVTAATTQTWNIPAYSTSGLTGAYDKLTENLPNLSKPGLWKTFGPTGALTGVSPKMPQ